MSTSLERSSTAPLPQHDAAQRCRQLWPPMQAPRTTTTSAAPADTSSHTHHLEPVRAMHATARERPLWPPGGTLQESGEPTLRLVRRLHYSHTQP